MVLRIVMRKTVSLQLPLEKGRHPFKIILVDRGKTYS